MLFHYDLVYQTINACEFIKFSTFNLAHWVFAFSYLVLSYRIELMANKLPEEIYKWRLNAVNIIACLFNVALPAIVWIFSTKGEYKAVVIAFDVE